MAQLLNEVAQLLNDHRIVIIKHGEAIAKATYVLNDHTVIINKNSATLAEAATCSMNFDFQPNCLYTPYVRAIISKLKHQKNQEALGRRFCLGITLIPNKQVKKLSQ